MHTYLEIIAALRDGTSERAIARMGFATRNTIAKLRKEAEERGWLAQESIVSVEEIHKVFGQKPTLPDIRSRVEPFHDIVSVLAQGGLAPKQIFRRLQERNAGLAAEHRFQGSIGSVKRYLRRHWPAKQEVYTVLQFEPGEQAQVDFGNGPKLVVPGSDKLRQTYIFVMTLSHSRHLYAELVWDQKIETWLRCHQNAFRFFQAVPKSIALDNLKSGVDHACRYDPIVQRSYFDFARAWGFKVDPKPPRAPRLKGRVESGVKYVKSAIAGLELATITEHNQALLKFALGEAGNRIHGTTKQMPLRVFVEEDQPAMLPFPNVEPDLSTWAKLKVHINCHVGLKGSFYSVPFAHVGNYVWAKVGLKMVEIFRDEGAELVALHPVANQPGQYLTNREHYPPEKKQVLDCTPESCLVQAEKLGPNIREFIATLLEDPVQERLSAARGSLLLAKKFGAKRLENAARRALHFGIASYRELKRILENGLDINEPQRVHEPFPEFKSTHFGRSVAELLKEAV